MTTDATAVAWALTTARIVNRDGERTVPAFVSPAAPGLAVTEIKIGSSESMAPGSPLYSVTHVASCCSVGGWYYLRPTAQALAVKLAALADWTRSGEEIVADTKLERTVERIVNRTMAEGV